MASLLLTVLAASGAPTVLTACIGAAIVVAESTQQLFEWQTIWLRYRVVTETLRKHGLLYLAYLAAYDGDAAAARGSARRLLRSIIEDERKQWAVQMKPPETAPHEQPPSVTPSGHGSNGPPVTSATTSTNRSPWSRSSVEIRVATSTSAVTRVARGTAVASLRRARRDGWTSAR